MKHLAIIQSEFLKQARGWDEVTYNEQKEYLKIHPKSKRRMTAKPEEELGNNGEPIKHYPEDDPRELR